MVRVQPAAVMDVLPAMRLLAQAHYHLAPLVVEGIPMMVRGTARIVSELPRQYRKGVFRFASARSQEEDQRREFAVPLLYCTDGYRELVDCTQTEEDEEAENAAAAENSQAVIDLHDGAQRVPDCLRQLGWTLARRPVRLRWSHAVDAESKRWCRPRSVAGTQLMVAVASTMHGRYYLRYPRSASIAHILASNYSS